MNILTNPSVTHIWPPIKKQQTVLFLTIALSTTIAIALPILSLTACKKRNLSREILRPFECGFRPLKTARKNFSMPFFLLALLFLIFDVEIAILLPIPLLTRALSKGAGALFITILTLGLFYEWLEGSLEWYT